VRFVDDARIPIDTNLVMRGMRPLAVGRKNHYGSKSERGTRVAALFYTLIESAKLAGLEPAAYLAEATHRAMDNAAPSRCRAASRRTNLCDARIPRSCRGSRRRAKRCPASTCETMRGCPAPSTLWCRRVEDRPGLFNYLSLASRESLGR
jgi:hypothetical protein